MIPCRNVAVKAIFPETLRFNLHTRGIGMMSMMAPVITFESAIYLAKGNFIDAFSTVNGIVPFVGNGRTLENSHECIKYTSRDDNKANQIGVNSKVSVASGENTDIE